MQQPATQPPLDSHPRRSRKRGVIALLVICVIVVGSAAWLVVPKVYRKWKTRQMRELVTTANAHWQAGKFELAFPLLRKAVTDFPSEPEVLRQVATCFDQLPYGAENAMRYWRRLQQSGGATWDDMVSMGRAHLRLDDVVAAQEIVDSLPKEVRGQRKTMEFQAALLARSGRFREAESLLRDAWTAHIEDPECRIQLAGLDTASPIRETRDAAFDRLWIAARGDGKISAMAMSALAMADGLSAGNRAELAMLAGKSEALTGAQRYAIFDSCISKSPALLPEAIAAAKKLLPKDQPAVRGQFYRWLSKHNQADTILQELPETEALQSRDLCMPYADALLRTKRWDDLERLLAQPELPLSKVDLELFSAIVARERGQPADSVRHHLLTAVVHAGRNSRELSRVGTGAEVFGHLDIAIKAFSASADRKIDRVEMLKRVYRLQKQRLDSAGMLKAAQDLLCERPGLPPYADSEIYLQLIAGLEMEDAVQRVTTQDPSKDVNLPVWWLCRALAAYHVGDGESMNQCLNLVSASGLEPGQRVVFAGLLRKAGRISDADAVVKAVPAGRILPEESFFSEVEVAKP
jgi:hypothetical protein